MSEDSSLSLSLSLSQPSSAVSCELVLATPSCVHKVTPPPPLTEAVNLSSSDSTTPSLDLSLSLPGSSASTLISGVELRTLDSAPVGLPAGGSSNSPPSRKPKEGEPQEPQARRETWQDMARSLMGTEPLLVLKKRLSFCDISCSHARFLFSKGETDKRQPKAKDNHPEKGPQKMLDMLTPAEKAAAMGEDGGLPVLLLNRWGENHPGNKLRLWCGGRTYVLVGKWSQFVRANRLRVDDYVEVYLFRVPPEASGPTPMPPPLAGSSSPAAPSQEAQALAAVAQAEPAVAVAPTEERGGGPPQGEWRLAVVVRSLVPPEEEKRRLKESPKASAGRRKQEEGSTAKIRRKRNKQEDDSTAKIRRNRKRRGVKVNYSVAAAVAEVFVPR